MANPVDFRARQIQTHKIIANDPDSTTGNRIVIYDVGADINALPNHGHVDAGVFPEFYLTGSDVFFYVSGARNDKGSVTPGVSVFAGDVVMSGSFYQGFGVNTKGGIYSHAEGYYSYTFDAESAGQNGRYAHVEGENCSACGDSSHAEGYQTAASGAYSHAGGIGTITKKQGQTAIGQWNTDNNTNSLFVVGNGAEILRSDIFKIEETGEIVLAGGVQHNALYDTNSPGSPLYLDKTNYLAIINSQAGNRNVYLPEIDVGNPAASVGLTVVIRQDDTSPSTRTVTIHVPTANSSYRINGFNLAAATLTLNAAPIPVVNASVTLTFMGVIGGTGRWFVTSVSQC